MTERTDLPVLTLAGLATLAVPALAEDSLPSLSGEIAVEVADDYVHDSSDPGAELNDLYVTIEPAFRLALGRRLSVNLGLVIEPVADAVDDRAFEDHGIYVEQLYVEWSGAALSLHAGKFNPGFGVAWDLAPGIYGADFAEDYELTEQWGGGIVLPLTGAGSAAGTLELSADLFFADTTLLSGSALNDRGRLRRGDGGAGNTAGPRSVSLTLGAGEIPSLPGFGYRAGAIFRSGGVRRSARRGRGRAGGDPIIRPRP